MLSVEIYKKSVEVFSYVPNNISVQGKISGETAGKDIHDNDDINIEW